MKINVILHSQTVRDELGYQPDTWYEALLAVDGVGNLLSVVWQDGRVGETALYSNALPDSFAGQEWELNLMLQEGRTEVDWVTFFDFEQVVVP